MPGHPADIAYDRCRLTRIGFGLAVVVLGSVPCRAQGTTASGIQGTVRTATGEPIDDARVTATHTGTGYGVEVIARRGRFVIQGLESGGPYSVSVRRIGFEPQRRDGLVVGAGTSVSTDFVLRESATTLDPVRTIAGRIAGAALAGGGIASTIDESSLRQLPSLNRDLAFRTAGSRRPALGSGTTNT